jgi:glucose-6-phosphate 1-dehydrogenase
MSLFVIFGATGDLVSRKLMPALYSLHCLNKMGAESKIIGVGRTKQTGQQYRDKMSESLQKECPDHWDDFVNLIDYQSIDIKDPKNFMNLLPKLGENYKKEDIIFYLAIPPQGYKQVSDGLVYAKLNQHSHGGRRLVIEKPFGFDLQSAKDLNNHLHNHWDEEQIYRIDHYLGKETVQNLLVFRFGNEIFESLWNRRYVDYIEISSAEDISVANRAAYFDRAGTIRDMVQNHLLQVLAMVTLEPPNNFNALSVRNETFKVLQNLRPWTEESLKENVILGQYASNQLGEKKILGYHEEAGIAPNSRTETFAAMKFFIDNSRWTGVPIYLRVGKRLPHRVTEVIVHFHKTPHPAFKINSKEGNMLVIRIQPDEGILLKFIMKKPGNGFETTNVNMDFHYQDLKENFRTNAYERLLMDALIGDATLYARSDAVEQCWKFVDPILQWRDSGKAPIHQYKAGSWGPEEADKLVEKQGHQWRYPCRNLSDEENYCSL